MSGINTQLSFLMVEDNPGDIFLLKEFLHATDLGIAHIFEVDRLSEAKRILAEQPIDLVFLDLSLPDSFGLDSYISLSAAAEHLPVILLTGLSDTNIALQALAMGAQDYLVKGDFDEKLLSRAIRYSLERKRNLQRLRESEVRYRELFNNNPMPMWVFDVDTMHFLESNAAAVEHYGYTAEEFLRLTPADLLHHGDLQVLKQEVVALQKDGAVQQMGLREHVRKNGDLIFVELAWHNVDYMGHPAVLAVANDVTERIVLENELNEQQMTRQRQITEAVILAQEKERTEIGKELHDNVNQILGASNLYVNTAMTDEEMRQELLERSTELISRAINEIRKISKSLITPGLREIGLLESIEDITEDMKVAKGIQIQLDIHNIVEAEVDEQRKLTLFRIIQEQLNNIMKHAKATEVLIRLSIEGEDIVLTVVDNGIGFDISRHRKGVGITNIISRTELFKGKVDIQSKPGDGCVLTVRVPMGATA
ncbi:MAG TPA: PAS domain S-box protein [Puia sp.]|nr:PAS domain S-box protein [Puia sp.]